MLVQISSENVRQVMLAAQGLLSPPEAPATAAEIRHCIRRMGYLQIDTIQVVARSPYLVLWSRLGDYDRECLGALHEAGHLFEYYAHALCYIPVEDYAIYRALMLADQRVWRGWQRWAKKHPEVVDRVREVVRAKGPVCSTDFKTERIDTGWGGAKLEKIALDYLFAVGELMIPYRRKFRRYYDLRQRVLPDWDDQDAPDLETTRRRLVLNVVRALGLAREDWAAPYLHFSRRLTPPILKDLAESGELAVASVPEWDLPVYYHPDQQSLVDMACQGALTATHTTLLSPFDPLISDRDRTQDLFGFDYKLESYTPVKDRRYGFFCLPILYNGRLVGRLDPKAHRKEKRMEIKALYLEPDFEVDDVFATSLRQTLADFTAWHGMKELAIGACEPAGLREVLA